MDSTPPPEPLSLLGLVNAALRQRRLVVQMTVLAVVVVVAITLLLPREYTARASFRSQARNAGASSMIPGIAAQLGLLAPLTDASQSPAFYVELLQSRQILGGVVTQQFPVPGRPSDTTAALIDLIEVKGKTADIRRERAIERLLDLMDVVASPRTGVITMTVTLKDPVLAEAVARRLLDELHRFNLQSRQSQARAERRFTEQRLGEVERDLRAAEDRLQTFLQRNRDYRNSPQLMFQQDRLMRDVSMQQGLYSTLAQSFEQSKIEEVRDTPVITLIDQPERPAQPDPRGLIKRGILAVLLGGILGLTLALVREGMKRSKELSSPEFIEFNQLQRETLEQLRLRPRKGSA
jgi:uncharacterized protein involved in exopolysaccharide biosynthesis